jgi:hypothetical protein
MLAAALSAAQFFPLQEVRPGLKGVGKTVFSGTRIEEFQVEILGVLPNIGPRQSLILARLSGGPLAETGVLQGMSGSPVYIGGKLLGAVAMGFAFSKEPIAGIRPIEDMLRVADAAPAPSPSRAKLTAWDGKLSSLIAPREDVLAAGERMVDIATPVSFGGFTRNTIEHFAPQLRALGLEPRQGMAGGGPLSPALGNPAELQPGSMISVQLISGDLSVGADGTVTAIDGSRVYAFGHRFLAVGATDLPFARAEVLTLLPNLSTSFKISTARDWMGTITQDRSTAVAGELGRRAATIPLAITLTEHGATAHRTAYRMRMVNDRVLSPFLLQLAMFSAIDATERTTGEATLAVNGTVEFEGGGEPLQLNNTYAGDFNLAAQAALATATPVAYAMQSGFDALRPKSVELNIDSFSRKRQFQIDQLWASHREVRPGETVELTVVLAGENGAELTRKVTYPVPVGAPLGPLQFTVADASVTNLTEFRQLLSTPPKSAAQLVEFINGLRANTKAYLRVWRTAPSYDVGGDNLPDPPPSLAMILARMQPSLSATPAVPNSRVAEFDIPAGDVVISGSKTIQVEVKE